MILGKIVGTVVATRKDARLVSSKLLIVRPMDPRGKAEGSYIVAVDTVDAGIVGIVDHWDVEPEP
jgi:ethanolamine utilization protein EutN